MGWAIWLIGRLGSNSGAWLLFHADVAATPIGRGERFTGWLLLGLAVAAWLPGRWASVVGLAGLIAATDAVVGAIQGGYAFAQWTPAAHGLRIAAPLSLALLLWAARDEKKGPLVERLGVVLLRVGTAAVFLAHGGEAMLGHPSFQDFLIGTAERLVGWSLHEGHVQPLLIGIGVMDAALALLVLSGRKSRWLWWAAAWGAITAGARVTTYGWEVYGDILLRLPHIAAPLALWCLAKPRADSASMAKATPD